MKDQIISLLSKETKLSKSDIINLLEVPKNSDLGDFAFPCFSLAKTLKKNPMEIAQNLSKKLKLPSEVEKIEVKGPYLNFFINKETLADLVLKKITKEKDKYGSQKIKEKVVIEFPSPNTNKPLHIGHARNLILGQSVSNILKFSGNQVKITNLINDRGIHICKSMIAYEKFGKGNTPEKSKKKGDHFVGDYYVKYAQEVKKNPQLEEDAKACLEKWEKNDKKTRSLWKSMNSWAYKGFNETYKKFNYKPEKNYYESAIYNSGKVEVINAWKKGIVKKKPKPDGAFFIDLSNEGLGEKILIRGNGTSIYITQDLFLALSKYNEFKFNKSIVITASEQNYHFKVLFSILNKLKYPWAKSLRHLSYGMVNLVSGRMKSREGNVVDSDELIDEMIGMASEEILKREPKLDKNEVKKRAEAIAMSAIRYYFLKVDKIRDVVFKPEESLKFEGDTGPYLLYTYARAKSILRKAKFNSKAKVKIENLSEKEKSLITILNNFPDIVQNSYATLSPNLVANYAFQLSQTFNEFYHEEKVLGSKNEQFKLSLVSSSAIVLKNALSILEISVLEHM